MGTKKVLCNLILNRLRRPQSLLHRLGRKGQAVVEFTLVFILLLVVAWIPADFGLGFFTGQLAQNAAREGVRIASADPTTVTASCGPPLSSCFGAGNILRETANRLPAALLQNATVAVVVDAAGSCNRLVTVTVSGTYNFFFYQILHLLNVSGNLNTRNVVRESKMRWEYNTGCSPT